MLDALMAGLSPAAFAAALTIALFAGFVKGAIGFAMPMIMISAFSSFLTPDLALAGLILPTLFTNFSQAFRQGLAAALATTVDYRRFVVRHDPVHRDLGAVRPRDPPIGVPDASGPADHQLRGNAAVGCGACHPAAAPQQGRRGPGGDRRALRRRVRGLGAAAAHLSSVGRGRQGRGGPGAGRGLSDRLCGAPCGPSAFRAC